MLGSRRADSMAEQPFFPTLKIHLTQFPKDFIFGTATSSYQIEGSAHGGCGLSHWDTFCAVPGNVHKQHNGSKACNHYHLWHHDLDLIKNCGLKAYRFSTSWSRIFPKEKALNQEGLDFYDRLVDGLIERNIDPFLTLYHWDLPVWMAAKGGWQNRDIIHHFAEYADHIARILGDRVKHIVPINEPWCVAWLSHYEGAHAPGLRDIRAAAHAMHHVLLAHGNAIQTLRNYDDLKLGFLTNHEFVQPANDEEHTIKAAEIYDALYNRWFLEAAYNKQYPQEVLAGLEAYLPNNFDHDFDLIAQPVDWHGQP